MATRQQTHRAGTTTASRALMTAEANAAVAGAFEGGATSVVVNDSHGSADNLLGEQLDPRAEYVVGDPKPLDMLQELTAQTGVVLFVGLPRRGGRPLRRAGAHLQRRRVHRRAAQCGLHQRSGAQRPDRRGGRGTAGAGDRRRRRLRHRPEGVSRVVTVPVKTARGRTAARSLHPAAARQAITAGAARAVANAAGGRLSRCPYPANWSSRRICGPAAPQNWSRSYPAPSGPPPVPCASRPPPPPGPGSAHRLVVPDQPLRRPLTASGLPYGRGGHEGRARAMSRLARK
ncbi:M55 family metallopeptidase [Streptacidiphilus sp. 4-A2]|nr:M55 family metallopeptidase [Streptacidiphilus sp. 4-A2]